MGREREEEVKRVDKKRREYEERKRKRKAVKAQRAEARA